MLRRLRGQELRLLRELELSGDSRMAIWVWVLAVGDWQNLGSLDVNVHDPNSRMGLEFASSLLESWRQPLVGTSTFVIVCF